MSKPMTKARLAELKSIAEPPFMHENSAMILELIAEIERLQRLAKPNGVR